MQSAAVEQARAKAGGRVTFKIAGMIVGMRLQHPAEPPGRMLGGILCHGPYFRLADIGEMAGSDCRRIAWQPGSTKVRASAAALTAFKLRLLVEAPAFARIQAVNYSLPDT